MDHCPRSRPRSPTAGLKTGGHARPSQISIIWRAGERNGSNASLSPRATSVVRLRRRGSGYLALDDPITDPLGERHRTKVLGNRSPGLRSWG